MTQGSEGAARDEHVIAKSARRLAAGHVHEAAGMIMNEHDKHVKLKCFVFIRLKLRSLALWCQTIA